LNKNVETDNRAWHAGKTWIGKRGAIPCRFPEKYPEASSFAPRNDRSRMLNSFIILAFFHPCLQDFLFTCFFLFVFDMFKKHCPIRKYGKKPTPFSFSEKDAVFYKRRIPKW
jgi:hypothetical protein